MKYRQIGSTGLNCSVIGLGTGTVASLSTGLSATEGIRLIHCADECGINLIDTADSYGQGKAEELVGRALKDRRSRFLVTSKAGFSIAPAWRSAGFLRPLVAFAARNMKGLRNGIKRLRVHAKDTNVLKRTFESTYIESSIDASLRRLHFDYLDLFFLHDPPAEAVQDEKLIRALEKRKQAGEIRFFGVSSNSLPVLEAASRMPGISCVQTAINPVSAEALSPFLLKIASGQLGVIGNQIFCSGLLLPKGRSAEFPHVLRQLEALSVSSGESVQRLLIHFALAQPGVSCVLTGTTQMARLRENVSDALGEPLAVETTNSPLWSMT